MIDIPEKSAAPENLAERKSARRRHRFPVNLAK